MSTDDATGRAAEVSALVEHGYTVEEAHAALDKATTPTPDEMVEELEGAARDLRACANKKKDAVESLTGFSLDAIAIYTGNAADLIQQQRSEIERLSAALEPFADRLNTLETNCRKLNCGVPGETNVRTAWLREARAALGKDVSKK